VSPPFLQEISVVATTHRRRRKTTPEHDAQVLSNVRRRNREGARRRRDSPSNEDVDRIIALSDYSVEQIPIGDIAPYDLNPRDNAEAIPAVEKSIREFGFKIPVVVDEDNVLVAGHTRVAAATNIGLPWVPAIRASDLTDEQIRAFRVIDNKVAEIAKWDFDMLATEVSALRDQGVNLQDFGWTEEELDCLSDVVSEDCLSGTSIDGLAGSGGNQRVEKRAPDTARYVCGEFVFFIPATTYTAWANTLRADHDFNEKDIENELKRRLQITDFED
jgi:hypothetical protein